MANNDVDKWIKNRKPHQVKALEKASKVFDDKDNLSVNTLEAIYGKESSFGTVLNSDKFPKGTAKPAGHFQQKKFSANEQGLITNPTNDQRFDIDEASISAAKQLKKLDGFFSKKTKLTNDISTIGISDAKTREIFTIAAYNIGQGRIAQAQALAKNANKDPKKWNDVKEFLIPAGANKLQAKEVTEYVTKVLKYKKEFEVKSKANKKLKDKKLKNKASKASKSENDGRWVTVNDKRFVIV